MTKSYHEDFLDQVFDSGPINLTYILEYEDGERVHYTLSYIGAGLIYLPSNLQLIGKEGRYPVYQKK